MTDLRLFDLNLLIAFDALMAERNVTLAARRVGIGQPAMSYALSRLRRLFADDLFVRTPSGMQPTTRALDLAGSVARILTDIRTGVLSDRAFRPEVAETVFRVGASDHAEVAVLSSVIAGLGASAPKVRLVVAAADRDRVGTMLESGSIDLAEGLPWGGCESPGRNYSERDVASKKSGSEGRARFHRAKAAWGAEI